jgi:hypothetical protein
MIIVKLWGGMGNQMFQYAFGRSLAHRHDTTLKLDLGFFRNQPRNKKHVFRSYDLDVFNIQEEFATEKEVLKLGRRFKNDLLERGFNRVLGVKRSHIVEPHFHFSPSIHQSPDDVYLDGYWQSEKYFSDIPQIIRSEFTCREPLNAKAEKLMDDIKNSVSICLNVRRGDFVTNSFHGTYGAEYFAAADAIISRKISGYTYYVFSDEIDWCEQNLKFGVPTVFVSHEYAGPKFQDYLRLMTACRHFVIPNSSFAWWAVWLNGSKDNMVIAPKKWFNDPAMDTRDLYLPGWIKI